MNMKSYPYQQITDIEQLPAPAAGTGLIVHYAFQYIDFRKVPDYAAGHKFVDCCFFGCEFTEEQYQNCESCLALPRMGMNFHAFLPGLYDGDSLYEGYKPGVPESFGTCFDQLVYRDYIDQRRHCDDLRVTLARALHDHSVTDKMQDFLQRYQIQDRIGVMGGHGLGRSDIGFEHIARFSKSLTEHGRLMVSGGGPGAMEATHFGAWMAGRTEDEFKDALDIIIGGGNDPSKLSWLDSAFKVRKKYPQRRYHSLAIPTWLYGHEASTPFATEIAKYFENSLREDTILTVASGGILFTPGSAGTMQEIFQEAAQNHYVTNYVSSPMVFLGTNFFSEEVPVYPFLCDLCLKGKYKNLTLHITDSYEEAAEFFFRSM